MIESCSNSSYLYCIWNKIVPLLLLVVCLERGRLQVIGLISIMVKSLIGCMGWIGMIMGRECLMQFWEDL